jgi:hypothetical protein
MKSRSKMVLPVLALALATAAPVTATSPSCCGQATAVSAHIGEQAHSQPTPQVGLRNLARLVAEDHSEAALDALVAGALGLGIEACRTTP